MALRPTPINPAEAIFEPFWDPAISQLSKWRQESDPDCGGEAKPFWSGAMLAWKRGGDGRCVLRMWRDVDWDVGVYDHIHLCISLAATTTLTIRVVADGVQQEPLTAATGRDGFHEYHARFVGRSITRIELELRDGSDAPGQSRLMWIGVFHDERRRAMWAAPSPFEGKIDHYFVPEPGEIQPALGLFFGSEQLETLRHKSASPVYAALVGQLRQRARAGLGCEPWRGIGLYPNEGGPRCGRGGEGGHIDPLAMRLGGLVGLLDRDANLLRMAARHAVAMAHCDHWFPDFMEAYPGSPFEQRAFFDYRYGTNVAYAWDWAGRQLNSAGRDLLAHALATKALPRIHETLMRHRYVRTCNQGAYMAYGAIVCIAALSKAWPLARDFIPPVRRALDDTAESYLMPDGGAAEGPGYVTSSLGHMLVAYQLLANLEGKSLGEVVPERVVSAAEYVLAMLSTAPPAGSAINVSDGGRPGATIYPDGLALLASLVGRQRENTRTDLLSTMSAIISDPLRQESFATPGASFVFLYGPDPAELPPPRVRPPLFKELQHTGQICSCRETPHGLVRLQIIGTPARASHSHEDYGSFVIEAFGEEIVIDRGQMQYSDPRCGVIKAARYHNLLIPLDETLNPMSQVIPSTTAILPNGRGDAATLHACIDATPAWGTTVKRWLRTFDSETPQSLVVTDEMEFAEQSRAAGFYLHSRSPWIAEGNRWVTRGAKSELSVTPGWEPMSAWTGEDFIDGGKQPVFTLILRASPANTHRLVTRLRVTAIAR